MRFLSSVYVMSLALGLAVSAPAISADYAREKNWANEVTPSVMTGDPVWLELSGGHKFLTLFTEAGEAKAGVIVVHGMGVHPDWGLIGPLRQNLPDKGYATLSIQMPVLQADAKGDAYPPTFDEAAERIKVAIEFMQAKGYKKIVVASHSMGSRMTAHFLKNNAGAPLAAWVAIGAPAALDFGKLKFPVLDLYGENDLPQVIATAKDRAKGLKSQPKSAQKIAPKADHFFNGKDTLLLEMVQGWLDQTL